jgi:hypothetical protein
MEAFHMLDYVVGYLCGEVLRSKGLSVNEAYSWDTIVRNKDDIVTNSSIGLIDSVYKRRKDRTNLSVGELHKLYIEAFSLFNIVLIRVASVPDRPFK